jgi:hypothetical protein
MGRGLVGNALNLRLVRPPPGSKALMGIGLVTKPSALVCLFCACFLASIAGLHGQVLTVRAHSIDAFGVCGLCGCCLPPKIGAALPSQSRKVWGVRSSLYEECEVPSLDV